MLGSVLISPNHLIIFHNDEKKKKFNNHKESQDYLNKLEIYNSFETEYILRTDQNKNCPCGCFIHPLGCNFINGIKMEI